MRVEAAAVGPTDAKIRRGELSWYVTRPLPLVPGWDLCGVVTATGEGVDGWSPGDRVVGMWDQALVDAGSYAEEAVLPAEVLGAVPAGVDAASAASLPISALTAAQVLDRMALAPGATLLVTGATGMVGGFALQLAAHRGLEAVPLARDATPEPGYVSVVPGGAPDPERGIEPEVLYVEANGAQLGRLAQLVVEGMLTPRVLEVLPLDGAAEAHRRFEAGGLHGRLVLDPSR